MAIFRLDPVNGSDTARTALTSCTASNVGGIANINKAGHGLNTGAVVKCTLFTAWLNFIWEVTRVDADNFTLNGATWQTTADTSGTCTPAGGNSWADAWRTAGAHTADTATPGDVIRVAKSPDPVDSGVTGTFTKGSSTVTLGTALTATVDRCETAWTQSANVTSTRESYSTVYNAEGTYFAKHSIASGFSTGKVSYYPIGSALNLSGFTALTFYLYNSATITGLRIDLCSDTLGATPVDSFTLPAYTSIAHWRRVTLTKNGGGALGSSIQSIALYATSDPGTVVISLDNIEACNSFSLQSIIGRNTADRTRNDCWYAIKSIVGTTVTLGIAYSVGYARNYLGETAASTAVYYRIPLLIDSTAAPIGNFGRAGTSAAPYTLSGGWNTTSDLQDGDTWVGCIQLYSTSYVATFGQNYWNVSRIHSLGFGQTVSSNGSYVNVSRVSGTGCPVGYVAGVGSTISDAMCTCPTPGSSVMNGAPGKGGTIKNVILGGIAGYSGIAHSGPDNMILGENIYIADAENAFATNASVHVKNVEVYNVGYVCDINYSSTIIYDLTSNSCPLVSTTTVKKSYPDKGIRFHNLDGVGNHRVYYYYGTIMSDTAEAYGGTGYCAKITPDATVGSNKAYCFIAPICTLPYIAATEKVITVKVKKDASYNGNTPKMEVWLGANMVATTTLTGISTSYQDFTLSYTSTNSEVADVVIVCDGTAGNLYVDEVSW